VQSAIEAIEYGALRYFVKPIPAAQLEEAVSRAVRLHQMARVRREALELYRAGGSPLGDRAGLEARFSRALDNVWIAYQPIVSWSGRSLFAYEALVRSEEPTMRGPGDLFAAAERLGRLHDLGRVIRARVAETIREVPFEPLVFVNVHTDDLQDATLFSPDSPLAPFASRVVLEITERAALDQVKDLMARMEQLRNMGYRIAVDDLGAGYAGLTSFAQLEPEVVKVDMSLVRGVDASPTKQKLLGSIIGLCHDLDIQIIAEGIETEAERDTVVRLGGDLCQGYLFARPGRPFPAATL
jgi:EAL domain-containing protein (putative c-di-GMP-specific phosphodiesterase class I)